MKENTSPLPTDATLLVNGDAVAFHGGTVGALLHQLGIAADRRGLAVAVNGTLVTRSDWDGARIEAGDRVEIVQPLAGG
ncbi:MAG: sulfur carrier protein ThiS [Alphaproteobacteria bacterium]